MTNPLKAAFGLAQRVAFKSSPSAAQSRTQPLRDTVEAQYRFLTTAVRISPAMTPDLARTMSSVCESFNIPQGHVEAYVSADSELQAHCYSYGQQCLLHVTSGVVNLLHLDELSFVFGHELGHWLLRHESSVGNRESRDREISADRMGLLACGSIVSATHAMMKVTSGLSGDHIRFDVQHFLAQLESVPDEYSGMAGTHPDNVVRCKLLLAFDTAIRQGLSDSAIERANTMVNLEMRKVHRGREKRLIKQYKMWFFMRTVVTTNDRFSKENQHAFRRLFGVENLNSMKGFLSLSSARDLVQRIEEKLAELSDDLGGAVDVGKVQNEVLAEVGGSSR